jgi:hypothetical protein
VGEPDALYLPASERANILVNFPAHGGQMEIVGDHTVRGISRDNGAVDGAYFVAEFSAPFVDLGIFRKSSGDGRGWGIGDKDVDPGARTVEGSYAGTYLTFHTKAGEQILMKMAHGASYEQAEQRCTKNSPAGTSMAFTRPLAKSGRSCSIACR